MCAYCYVTDIADVLEAEGDDIADGDVDMLEDKLVTGGVYYDYLLAMPLWNLTFEKVTAFEAELAKKVLFIEKNTCSFSF